MKTNIIFMGNGGTSELTSLESVIDRKLIIPSYQRPYAWNEDNIEDLFNTIKDSFEKGASSQKHPAFFGSVIFSTKDDHTYRIIDGQQRVTTFLFILKVILEKINDFQKELAQQVGELDSKAEEEYEKGDKKSRSFLRNEMLTLEKKIDRNNDLSKKIEEILKKADISREETGSSSESKEEEECIKYIKGDFLTETKDFEVNKSKVLEKVDDIMQEAGTKLHEKYAYIIDYILTEVCFCLLNIRGEDSEEYAIDVFNTLNTTGESLTGFDIFRSTIIKRSSEADRPKNEKKLNDIKRLIKKVKPNRKDMITQTGKLLLYLAIHRDDYKSNSSLSDKKFTKQNSYIKKVVNKDSFSNVLDDVTKINKFVTGNWLANKKENRKYTNHFSSNPFTCKSFDFLKDIGHDRTLPVIYKWSEECLGSSFNKKDYKKIIELCTSFSCLWRMASHGGASGIDQAYLKIAKKIKDKDINEAHKVIWNEFKSKFPEKEDWTDEVLKSRINGNKKITKFLLALVSLKDISDYQTSDYVSLPISEDVGSTDTLGNIVLIPKKYEKNFKDNKKDFLSKLANKFSNYNNIYDGIEEDFSKEQITQRTKQLSDLLWEKLAENVFNTEERTYIEKRA